MDNSRAERTAPAADGVDRRADGPRLADVLAVLEELYPPATAQSWDRVGLVAGDPDQPVGRILLAVDPTLDVIAEAVDAGADLLVTHHPLLLRGIHSVATTTAKGAAVTDLVVNDVALYCAHTNADVADPGVGHALAAACGLAETEPLQLAEEQELGRVGDLPEETSLAELARRLHAALPPTAGGVRVSGPAEAPVRRVAVLGGAGDSSFGAVRRSGADVYVTADLRHHPALEAREEARAAARAGAAGTPYLVDAGHYASEWLWLPGLRDLLRDRLPASVDIQISTVRTDPWDFVVGAQPPTDAGGMP
ncbi:Nif3-like dinuclear metal center hexameric protein [Ornithinimicrobium humiphilum]|uniref:GTP cyclohydrolase 1 type 2 homolog n=1 Tax=Ornithinimicrobium humiphilum TaxID=125288 RepID=A0A543KPV2_9MICO|nr:Nif3-like dinuclear metal center hexameric protein [Ornithinimicrobium humiphilum]TQM97097.1 dinuclear metal center YbgI/SA1388 family protein [Ornithinimicrobium humiphilum]